MVTKSYSWWPAYLALILTVAIRLVPLAVGTTWFWGVGQLTLLSFEHIVAYLILAAVVLILPFTKPVESWGERLGTGFDHLFYNSKLKFYYRGLVVLAAGTLFTLFLMPTHFLGDGYQFLVNIGSNAGHWVKWSEAGAMRAVMLVSSLFGPPSEQSALRGFQVLSVVSGIGTLWFYFLLTQTLSENPIKRLVTFSILVLSSTLLLSFGYVESYPVVWCPIVGFLYFGLRYAEEGRGLVPALACLALALVLHLQAGMFVPAAVYLAFSSGKGLELFQRFKGIAAAGVVLVGVVVLGTLGYKYATDLSVEVIFLYPFSGKPMAPGYAIFSPRHLVDMLNLFMLVFPAGLVLIGLVSSEGKKRLLDVRFAFLSLLSIGSLLFLMVIDPGLSMARDWDLFSLCWLAPTVLALYLIPDSRIAQVKRLALSIILASILGVVPWLLVNLNEERSIGEITQIIDDNPDKSLGSMTILGSYYERKQEYHRVDSINARMELRYPDFYKWKKAFQLLKSDKVAEAAQLIAQTRPDKFSKDYHSVMAGYYLKTGAPDSALAHSRAAIQLQPYVDQTYALLAFGHMLKGERDAALAALRRGYDLNARNKEIVVGLSLLYTGMAQYDSSLYYATRLKEVDSTNPVYYYVCAKALYGKGELQGAREQAMMYLMVGRGSSGYPSNSQELLHLIPDLAPRDSGTVGQTR